LGGGEVTIGVGELDLETALALEVIAAGACWFQRGGLGVDD